MQCPKCKALLIDQAVKCHECGYELSTSVDQTLDPSHLLKTDEGPADGENKAASSELQNEKLGSERISEEGDSSPDSVLGKTLQAPEAFDANILKTMRSATNAHEGQREQQIDDDVASSSSDGQDAEATMDINGLTTAGDSTDFDLQSTMPLDREEIATSHPSDATVDMNQVAGTLADRALDEASTDATMEYDSRDVPSHGDAAGPGSSPSGSGTQGNRSGSAGRLNRIWQGAGGSGSNPMHTLKGGGAMASDSIFERVASRVLVSETLQRIIEEGVKRVGDRESVRQCIETACQDAAQSHPDYHINGFLGKGGMGIVMQARQTAIGRDVALKMILPSSSGSRTVSSTRDQQKKFLYEAQITGKLDHPNIVPVYELGTCNGILFYSMKKIEGTEWTNRIKEFSLDENLDIWMKVADAMAFSHQRQIIHRDLKPDNVMLGPFGEVLVTDWGCAVDLSLREAFNGAGSPPWMAPEMAVHRLEKIGVRSDIYLLGAILYQIIQGYPPHPGRTAMEVLQTAAKNQIIPVEDPNPLLQIAFRSMETDPADRYSSVEEMQDAIREYRRHSESIVLADRSESILQQAISTKDYERFSRSVFGFQDALDLWPENSSAVRGLARARYAYGECAFARKDFDLCLATLDRSQPDENALYLRAEKAKEADENKSKWLRTALRALAATILIGLAATSVFAGIAWFQRNEAIAQRTVAERAREDEEKARLEAVAAQGEAERAAEAESLAKEDAISQRMLAESAKEQALKAAESEREAKEEAVAERMAAEDARNRAVSAAEAERKAKEETERRTAQVELAGMQSNLSLALSQVEQLDIGRASELLDQLIDDDSYVTLVSRGEQPTLKNWAWNRINMLSNRDLLQESWGQMVTGMDFAPQARRGVVALKNGSQGRLQLFRLDGNRMVLDDSYSLDLDDSFADAVMISADARQVIYSLASTGGGGSVYRWNLQDGQTSAMNRAGNRSLQGFADSSQAVVGGLNNGLWVWKNDGQRDLDPERITSIQGRMLSIQLIDEQWILLLAQMVNGERYAHLVSLRDPEQRVFLRVQDALAPDRVSAVAYANGRLILGTESGRIFGVLFQIAERVQDLLESPESGVLISSSELVEFSRQHHSRIRAIKIHSDGSALSIADEPLVNLWRPAKNPSGYAHEMRLTGTPGNVVETAFVSNSDHVMAVDENARSIVWDVVRQRQRQKVERVMADGRTPLPYDAPVSTIVACQGLPHAVSILENGRVDRWDIQTGQSLHQSAVPFAYVGHDPKAQFVDMAIDESSGVLITSARLPRRGDDRRLEEKSGEQISSDPAQSDWEFVKWDLNDRRMLDRWSTRAQEEQAISLTGGSKYVLYGSDSETRLRPPGGQSEWEFQRQDFGSFFGVVHPIQSRMIMLVKLNGVVMMLDTDNLEGTWKRSGYQLSPGDFYRLATKGDRPIIGQWAPSGDAFYLVWDSGRVTEVLWENEQLALGRDLSGIDERIDLSTSSRVRTEVGESEVATSVRIGSRWNIDMAVRTQDGFNAVYALVRFPGADGTARLSRIAFPIGGGTTIRDQVQANFGALPATLGGGEVPQFSMVPMSEINKRLSNVRGSIVGSRTIGEHCYVATRQGTVYRVGTGGVQVYGRPRLISATGDRSGNVVVTLHEGGILWRGDWTGSDWDWRQLEEQTPDSKKVALSPDGLMLWVQYGQSSRLVSASSGAEVPYSSELAGCEVASWRPGVDATLVAVNKEGKIMKIIGNDCDEVGKLSGRTARSLHFFTESWNDQHRNKTPWLAIHCQSADGLAHHELVYAMLESEDWIEEVLPLPGNVTAIECSPTEGLITIGGQGTVGVYFASPSLGETGKQLFSLSGHAGSEIVSLRFSEDGKTLISADTNHRIYSWLSTDALAGMTEEMALAIRGID